MPVQRYVSVVRVYKLSLLPIVFHFVHRLIHNSCMFCVCQSLNKETTYLLTDPQIQTHGKYTVHTRLMQSIGSRHPRRIQQLSCGQLRLQEFASSSNWRRSPIDRRPSGRRYRAVHGRLGSGAATRKKHRPPTTTFSVTSVAPHIVATQRRRLVTQSSGYWTNGQRRLDVCPRIIAANNIIIAEENFVMRRRLVTPQ